MIKGLDVGVFYRVGEEMFKLQKGGLREPANFQDIQHLWIEKRPVMVLGDTQVEFLKDYWRDAPQNINPDTLDVYIEYGILTEDEGHEYLLLANQAILEEAGKIVSAAGQTWSSSC